VSESLFGSLRERAVKEPLGVDISDYSDEYCAGFLAGQVNALDEADRVYEDVRMEAIADAVMAAFPDSDPDGYDAADLIKRNVEQALVLREALRRCENDWTFIFNLAPGLPAEIETVLHVLAEVNLRTVREALGEPT